MYLEATVLTAPETCKREEEKEQKAMTKFHKIQVCLESQFWEGLSSSRTMTQSHMSQ